MAVRGKRRTYEGKIGEVLGAGVTKAGEDAAEGVLRLLDRYAVKEAGVFATAAADRGDVEAARGLVLEMRAATGEALLLYKRRGYGVEKVGAAYERALGASDFRGAEAFGGEAGPAEVVRAVIHETGKAWTGLAECVRRRAQADAASRVAGTRRPSPEEKVVEGLASVWEMESKDMVLGGRMEELRSGLGLRTLAALTARYSSLEKRGRAEGMPKAYLWAERAYWLTKHGIRYLAGLPGNSAQAEGLGRLGAEYEESLGASGLARESGGAVGVGDEGWDVVHKAGDFTAETWAKIKALVK